ncbi:hypothetical protein NQZ68_039374 [Dissostichus eleginoides]|nr:hypothetical protein NQZ68_039374 [Dissostichus eleginoides]
MHRCRFLREEKNAAPGKISPVLTVPQPVEVSAPLATSPAGIIAGVLTAVWHLGLNSCLEARYGILSSILRKDHSLGLAVTDCLKVSSSPTAGRTKGGKGDTRLDNQVDQLK